MKYKLLFAALAYGMNSCKGKKEKNEKTDDTEMARGTYNAEKNVVTVVPLERKAFNKQLVCNGKLEAQSKVGIQFSAQGAIAQVNVRDGQKVLPRGNTKIKAGDSVVIITKSFEDNHTFLEEHTVKPGGRWAGKRIMDYDRPERGVVVMIRRGEKNTIPDGKTVLQVGDVLVLCHISPEEQTETHIN